MIPPDIVTIPGGWFLMGSIQGQENEQPCHRVWVDSFGIGRFPVTNHEYTKFIEATQKQPPPFFFNPIFSDSEKPSGSVRHAAASKPLSIHGATNRHQQILLVAMRRPAGRPKLASTRRTAS